MRFLKEFLCDHGWDQATIEERKRIHTPTGDVMETYYITRVMCSKCCKVEERRFSCEVHGIGWASKMCGKALKNEEGFHEKC